MKPRKFLKKFNQKLLSLMLILSFLIGQLVIPLAYAEELGSPTIETANQTTQDEPVLTGDSQPDDPTSLENNTEESDQPDIINDSENTVESTSSAESDTGGNDASINAGDVSTDTGQAGAQAVDENLVNVNLTGDGSFDVTDVNDEAEGAITLAPADSEGSAGYLSVGNTSNSSVNNNVSAVATSGDNSADGNAGAVDINTGDAKAEADVFNLVNFNVTGSGWTVRIVNIFGVLKGDIIIDPRLLTGTNLTGNYNLVIVDNNSTAYVINNVNVLASTGDNEASDNAGSVKIKTGDAQALTTIVDLINNNIYGDNFFFLLVNNLGEWVGKVVDAECKETACPLDNVNVYTQGLSSSCPDDSCLSDLTVLSNSSAMVENNVDVYAATGGNSANGNAGDVNITTGDANASAKILNIINSNIVGRNFFVGLINIFGSWLGNLILGNCPQGGEEIPGGDNDPGDHVIDPSGNPEGGPILGVYKENDAPNGVITPGNYISFTISVRNYGDSIAKAVQVYDKLYDPNKNSLTDQSWYVGDLQPGEEVKIDYTIYLSSKAPTGLWENKASAKGQDLGGIAIDSGEASSVFTLIPSGIIAASAPLGANVTGEVLGAAVTPETGLGDRNQWQLFTAD